MKKIFILLLVLLNSNNLFASSKINKIAIERVEAVSTVEIDYNNLNKQLSEIEQKLLKRDITVEDTNNYIKILNNIENLINEAKKEDETNLSYVQKRIESLGEKPEDNVVEDQTVVNQRKEFLVEENLIKIKIAKNDLILTKLNELEELILNFRNQTLLDNILNRQSEVVKPKFILENTKNFAGFVFDILRMPYKWYSKLDKVQKAEMNGSLLSISLMTFFFSILACIGSIFIKKYYGYKKNISTPDYIKKIKTAIIVFFTNLLIYSTIIGTLLLFIIKNQLLVDTNIKIIFSKLLIYIFYIFLLSFTAKAIFVPCSAKWRLINISNEKAKSITFISILSIAIIFIFNFFEYATVTLEYPINVAIYIKVLSCLAKIICIMLIAKVFFYETEEKEENAENIEDKGLDNKAKIKIGLFLFATALFFICFFGYVNLAYYILDKSIISITLSGIAYIISNLVNVLFHKILLLRFWARSLKLTKRQLVRINIWFSLIINPLILVILIFILLGLWGFSTDLLLQNIKRFLNGFYIGNVKISIISICFAILAFFISISIFRLIKFKLLIPTLSKTDMDAGVRDSLASGFTFFSFLASVFFSIAIIGGNFSNLAIVAGALSFGVGLGLQNIVNNLVSGILILFERPIKIGDVVNIGGQEGTVKQINIRSTQLETFTKSNIIIPNSNIISDIVLNKTLNNKQARVDLNFVVDSSNDPKEMIDILLNIAKNNDRVMTKPAPSVAFNSFTRNSLDFTLKIYINDLNNQQDIVNEVLIAAFYKFNEKNIELKKDIMYLERT